RVPITGADDTLPLIWCDPYLDNCGRRSMKIWGWDGWFISTISAEFLMTSGKRFWDGRQRVERRTGLWPTCFKSSHGQGSLAVLLSDGSMAGFGSDQGKPGGFGHLFTFSLWPYRHIYRHRAFQLYFIGYYS